MVTEEKQRIIVECIECGIPCVEHAERREAIDTNVVEDLFKAHL